jgi:hypothetical protein
MDGHQSVSVIVQILISSLWSRNVAALNALYRAKNKVAIVVSQHWIPARSVLSEELLRSERLPYA